MWHVWCSGYHYCTTSFNKARTQVLRRLKSCSRRVRDSRRWGSLAVVPGGNKAKCLSSVNHTTKESIIIIIIIMLFMIDTIDIASYGDNNTLYSLKKNNVTSKQNYKTRQSNALNGFIKMAWKLIKINAIFCQVLRWAQSFRYLLAYKKKQVPKNVLV